MITMHMELQKQKCIVEPLLFKWVEIQRGCTYVYSNAQFLSAWLDIVCAELSK